MKTEEPREYKDGFLVLPKNFVSKGFIYNQIKRKGLVAIYQKYKEKNKYKEHYETVIILRNPKRFIHEMEIEAREVFPGDEQWGTLGFTHSSFDRALEKFNELVKKEEMNNEK
mgnify:CR=1 FL=1